MALAQGEDHVDTTVYPLQWQAPGLRLRWVGGPFATAGHGQSEHQEIGRCVLNAWARWERWDEPFVPALLGMRKGIDKRGTSQAWWRTVVEATCSTTGLLAWLVTNATEAKGVAGDCASQSQSLWLERLLADLEVDLRVPAHEASAQGLLRTRVPL